MKRCFWLLLFLVGCEAPREKPQPLDLKLPIASSSPAPSVVLFVDIYRRRPVPPGTETNVDHVETELAKAPKDPKRLKAVGLAYYASGGYEAAIKKLTGLDDPQAQLYLGLAHMGLGDSPEALVALKKANGPVALIEQGNIYFQALRKDSEAEKCYQDAGNLYGSAESVLAMGLLRASQGKTAEARDLLLIATRVLPAGKARAAAFAALGRLEGDPDKARTWYAKTRKDDPENPWLKKLSQ